jgi:hypothetical protein
MFLQKIISLQDNQLRGINTVINWIKDKTVFQEFTLWPTLEK